MKGLYFLPLSVLTLLLGACATTVKPTYVSPTQYQSLNCQQLQSEYNRIQLYIENGVQTPKRTGVGVGVGLGGGWGRGGWGFTERFSQHGTIFKHQKYGTFSRIRSARSDCSGSTI